jgi:hypothetical protein
MKTASNGMQRPIPPPNGASRPPSRGRAARYERETGPPVHRSTRSQEEEQRLRNGGKQRGHRANWTSLPILLTRHDIARTDDLDATPNRLWSIALASRLIPRMRGGAENAGIESEGRQRTGKTRTHASSKPKKPNQRLDVIDKLDVTSIYGMGRVIDWTQSNYGSAKCVTVFHHDGPFDACNPHRNRTGAQRAPCKRSPKILRTMYWVARDQ